MRYLSEVVLMCCVLVAINSSFHTLNTDVVRDRHARKWIEWLGPLEIGDSAETTFEKLAVECVLHGKKPLGGTGAVEHIFVLDDVTEMSIVVDCEARISSLPLVRDRGQWLRFPDGILVSVVNRPELRQMGESKVSNGSRADAESGGPGGGGDEAR